MNSNAQNFLDSYIPDESTSDSLPEGITYLEVDKLKAVEKKMVEFEPGKPKPRYTITFESGVTFNVNGKVIEKLKEAKNINVLLLKVKRIGLGKQSKFEYKLLNKREE